MCLLFLSSPDINGAVSCHLDPILDSRSGRGLRGVCVLSMYNSRCHHPSLHSTGGCKGRDTSGGRGTHNCPGPLYDPTREITNLM